MTWWAWALIIWASLASAAVVALTVRLCQHVEWREATLTARYGLVDDELRELGRIDGEEGPLARTRTALRQMAAQFHRRTRLEPRG